MQANSVFVLTFIIFIQASHWSFIQLLTQEEIMHGRWELKIMIDFAYLHKIQPSFKKRQIYRLKKKKSLKHMLTPDKYRCRSNYINTEK